ncbi:DUF982 domain-containing protein [Neorhizobium galegae]|uniref:DUF982 domain-containing protein n=1 Tax=Neorhizobium galegae bv. orientalis str. HAMBI 540 TaxID=1028800 RepID=A0A068T385_NEOGA|nr:DUF982 domain-containing protein [Neorhizobium galegae]MCQ1854163.1 DUF982 domain-containing protein [Neorhizobium galegae]CDN51870.1 Hypothetical protein RG540_PA11940 [Neorhizobium galegae bv. orientalis str. HAMBI 540]
MFDPKRWRRPVVYEDENGLRRKVSSTEQASDILTSSWPVNSGEEFLRAHAIFLEVMSGSRPVAEARAAFLRAAEEADLDISGN